MSASASVSGSARTVTDLFLPAVYLSRHSPTQRHLEVALEVRSPPSVRLLSLEFRAAKRGGKPCPKVNVLCQELKMRLRVSARRGTTTPLVWERLVVLLRDGAVAALVAHVALDKLGPVRGRGREETP